MAKLTYEMYYAIAIMHMQIIDPGITPLGCAELLGDLSDDWKKRPSKRGAKDVVQKVLLSVHSEISEKV